MTKAEAHKILDNARAGCLTAEQLITEALGVTGDLASHATPQPVLEPTHTWPYYAVAKEAA